MSLRTLRPALAGLLALALNALLAPAEARPFVGVWDPPYGSPFTNLGWRGETRFDIPAVPPCNTDGAACVTGASISSAQVLFYDLNTNANIAQIDWSAAELSGVGVNGLLFSGNEPVQFATDSFPAKFPALYLGVNGADYGAFDVDEFSLRFVIGEPVFPPVFFSASLLADVDTYSGPLLFWRQSDCNIEFCDGGVNDITNPANRPILVVTQVPEPGSVALLAAALVAAGAASRRRRG